MELYVNEAPQTCHNFMELAKRGYYDGTKVRREEVEGRAKKKARAARPFYRQTLYSPALFSRSLLSLLSPPRHSHVKYLFLYTLSSSIESSATS